MSIRPAVYLTGGLVLLLVAFVVGFQVQHLVCSTARLKNESSHQLSGAVIRVGDATVSVGDIGPGGARFVWLPRGGDAATFPPTGEDYVETHGNDFLLCRGL